MTNSAAVNFADRSLHIIVRIANEQFAFPVMDVEEALDAPTVEWVPVAPDGMLGQLRHRGRMVSAWDARWAFGMRAVNSEPQSGAALILRDGPRRFALVVDDVVEMSKLTPANVQSVPASADLDGALSGVCFAQKRGGAGRDATVLVNVVRVEALVARAAAPVTLGGGAQS